MPRIYDEGIPPTLLYPAYYATYVERDVRQLINVSNQHGFETFLKLLAGRAGQVVNMSDLSGSIGISSTTLNAWWKPVILFSACRATLKILASV